MRILWNCRSFLYSSRITTLKTLVELENYSIKCITGETWIYTTIKWIPTLLPLLSHWIPLHCLSNGIPFLFYQVIGKGKWYHLKYSDIQYKLCSVSYWAVIILVVISQSICYEIILKWIVNSVHSIIMIINIIISIVWNFINSLMQQ